eukprot:5929701-Alexandrium_andersonii.AAC.1
MRMMHGAPMHKSRGECEHMLCPCRSSRLSQAHMKPMRSPRQVHKGSRFAKQRHRLSSRQQPFAIKYFGPAVLLDHGAQQE